MAEVLAAKEKIETMFPLENSQSLTETRVRGSSVSGTACIGAWSWISSTTRSGCGHEYDETASVSLVQRYYSNQFGRFMTPDPYKSGTGSGDPTTPQSWNRFAYVEGDPVNGIDPQGTNLMGPDDISLDSVGFFLGSNPWCMAQAFTGIPSFFCHFPLWPLLLLAADEEADRVPSALKLIDTCFFKNGTRSTQGYTLEAEYQVVDEAGQPFFGNYTLNSLSVVITEKVTTTSGPQITAGGVWCPSGGRCAAPGSMTSQGKFWDDLSGDPSGQTSTANQTFYLQGQALPVLSFSGNPTVLKNTYSTKGVTVNGITATRECGTKSGDPAP